MAARRKKGRWKRIAVRTLIGIAAYEVGAFIVNQISLASGASFMLPLDGIGRLTGMNTLSGLGRIYTAHRTHPLDAATHHYAVH